MATVSLAHERIASPLESYGGALWILTGEKDGFPNRFRDAPSARANQPELLFHWGKTCDLADQIQTRGIGIAQRGEA